MKMIKMNTLKKCFSDILQLYWSSVGTRTKSMEQSFILRLPSCGSPGRKTLDLMKDHFSSLSFEAFFASLLLTSEQLRVLMLSHFNYERSES